MIYFDLQGHMLCVLYVPAMGLSVFVRFLSNSSTQCSIIQTRFIRDVTEKV